MYDMSKLFDVEDDVLQAELDRRSKLREASWPRRTIITCGMDVEEDGLGEFLTNNCGFVLNSKEYNNSVSAFGEVDLEVEVYNNGQVKIVGVVDRTRD